jgi:hypothetical protein
MSELSVKTPPTVGPDGKAHRQYRTVTPEEFQAILDARVTKAAKAAPVAAPAPAPVAVAPVVTAPVLPAVTANPDLAVVLQAIAVQQAEIAGLKAQLALATAPKAKRVHNPGTDDVKLVSLVREGNVNFAQFTDKPSDRIRLNFVETLGGRYVSHGLDKAWRFGAYVTKAMIEAIIANKPITG